MRFTPDGKWLIGGDFNAQLEKGNTDTWEVTILVGNQGTEIGDVDVSPDGKYIASVSQDGEFLIWDLAAEKVVQRLSTEPGWGMGIEFVSDSHLLLHTGDAASG